MSQFQGMSLNLRIALFYYRTIERTGQLTEWIVKAHKSTRGDRVNCSTPVSIENSKYMLKKAASLKLQLVKSIKSSCVIACLFSEERKLFSRLLVTMEFVESNALQTERPPLH